MRGRSEVAVQGRLPEGVEDPVKHARIVAGDLAVGKPQNLETLACQPSVAVGVADRVVKGAIGFHNQPVAKAEEVDDIGSDRDLSTELESLQSSAAQQFPQEPLGGGFGATQGAGLAGCCGANHGCRALQR